MFKATIQDVSEFKDSLDAVSSLILEGTFEITEDEIKLVGMDPASVVMVVLDVLPSMFLDYEVEGEHEITLSLSKLVDILKRARADDKITFELEDNKLNIKMEGDFDREFSVPLLETQEEEKEIPDLDFNLETEIDSSVFKDGIKDVGMVSDCMVLKATSNDLIMESFGDASKAKLELGKESPSLVSLESDGEMSSKYSIDYLEKILKAAKISDSVTLKFSEEYPLKVIFRAVNKLELDFILAPRVDTE